MNIDNDTRLLRLDFIGECGDMLASSGAAIAAAASAVQVVRRTEA